MAGLNATILNTQVPTSSGAGPLTSLDQSDYDFSTTRYPSEGLATADVPHYVVFNINLPTNSKYVSNTNSVANAQSASQKNYDLASSANGKFQGSVSQVATAGLGGAAIGGVSAATGGGGSIVGGGLSAAGVTLAASQIDLQPKLQRIKKAIAIYMPETIVSEYTHDWQAASMTEALGSAGQAAALGGSVVNLAKSVGGASEQAIKSEGSDFSGFKNVIPATFNNAQGAETLGTLAQAAGAGSDFTALALKGQNAAINPMVEMVFRGTGNRGYQFVFDFQPRSASEAATIQDIIKTFKMYAAAEINTKANKSPGGSGRYFIPPAQFDISFYFMNQENPNIARISTCALTQITVNYNQSGQFASFTDGHPVHINMILHFTEMDIITRELIENFGY